MYIKRIKRWVINRMEQEEGIPVFSMPDKQIIVEEPDGTETLLPMGTPGQQTKLQEMRLQLYNDLDVHNPVNNELRGRLMSALKIHTDTASNTETPFEDGEAGQGGIHL